MEDQRYDMIGDGYSKHRCADSRIVSMVLELLSVPPGSIIADIGAGTGNYAFALASRGYYLQAIEPSAVMRSQATPHVDVRWSEGTAESIPLAANSVDAVVCILAAHHFGSLVQAITEMNRICREGPVLLLTFDPRQAKNPWIADYFPSIWDGAFAAFPPLADVMEHFAALGRDVAAIPFEVPWDLQDCFMAVGWRRPEMYLDRDVRKCMSGFALANQSIVEAGLSRLSRELANGSWRRHHGSVLQHDTTDWGYRFLLSRDHRTKRDAARDGESVRAPSPPLS